MEPQNCKALKPEKLMNSVPKINFCVNNWRRALDLLSCRDTILRSGSNYGLESWREVSVLSQTLIKVKKICFRDAQPWTRWWFKWLIHYSLCLLTSLLQASPTHWIEMIARSLSTQSSYHRRGGRSLGCKSRSSLNQTSVDIGMLACQRRTHESFMFFNRRS